jgi:hypothetical protein
MTLAGKFGDPKTERDILSAKRFNFFALIVLIGLIFAAFILYLQLVQKQRQLEIKTQELADSTENLRRLRSELEAAQSSLLTREKVIENQLQSLSNSVENRDFDSAMLMANRYNSQIAISDSTERMLVHLYAWQPQQKVMTEFQRFLVEPSYLLVKNETLEELPEWMGLHSTIYYYSPEIESRVRKLAIRLSKIARTTFTPVLGRAEEAPQNEHHHWIRIHYLGANPLASQQ